MNKSILALAAATLILPSLSACETAGDAAEGVASAGEAAAEGAADVGEAVVDTAADAGQAAAQGVTQGVPSLVNVNLENVLNDLALNLNLDRVNIPINAQIPIQIAANVCGVSINILAISTGGQANCTATTSSPELAQVVQQQMAAGGSVGGGAQGGSTAGTSGTSATSGAATSGATGTTTQSTGSAQGTTTTGTGTTQTGTTQTGTTQDTTQTGTTETNTQEPPQEPQ
jgi:hypothetical protein